MGRTFYARRREIELNLLAFELTERRFGLLCRVVLLGITVASAGAAIACAIIGHPWQTQTMVGSPGAASGIALALHALKIRR